MKDGGQAEWDFAWEQVKIQESEKQRILTSLGCSKDIKNLKK